MTSPRKAALVTGGATGIGRSAVLALARAGFDVAVNYSSSEAAARDTAAEVEKTGARALLAKSDVSDENAVRAMAAKIDATFGRLDVLVNNAGIGTTDPGGGERVESADGHELRFAVNYLAPFLLTRLLEPLLLASTPARIVNVASAGQAPVDFGDVMLEHGYDGGRAYSQSKLAMISWTFDLAERFAGRGVTATALHPGTYMPTKMVLAAGVEPFDSLETGVRSTIRLIADPALDGVTGRYFDRLEEARARPQAYDPDARRKLRELSERLVGLVPAQ
jgi:NAD(P)-dependent dehydrogenase (short-subunit alcohol dehydrogenase family)